MLFCCIKALCASGCDFFFLCLFYEFKCLMFWLMECFFSVWGCNALDLSFDFFFLPLTWYIIPNSSLLTVTALFHMNNITWPLWRGNTITHKHLILVQMPLKLLIVCLADIISADMFCHPFFFNLKAWQDLVGWRHWFIECFSLWLT